MKRRALLTTVGAGVTGLAGCLGLGGGDGGSSSGSDSTPTTPTFTPVSGGPELSLERINASGQAQIGNEYSFEVAVTNTGDRPGIYRAPIKLRGGGDVEFETIDSARIYVEPGETQTATISIPEFQFIGEANVRFESPRNEWSVDIVGPELPFGQFFSTPVGLRLTVRRVELQEEYAYTSAGEEQTAAAPDGSQWAFLYVEIRNRTGGESFGPEKSQFTLQTPTADYDPAFISREQNKYFQQRIPEEGRQRGWIGYEVSDSLTIEDVSVNWVSRDESRPLEATWVPPGGGTSER